ncbi:hypothetical protein DTPHA_1404878 [Enterococcus faecium]|nr:hypothetical protein DTPHA_1404878 [Enterococcus faecium]
MASLINPSPSKTCITDSGMFKRFASELTATASVGPKEAPKAKQAAIGIAGKILCRTKPKPNSVKITPPKANNKINPKCFKIDGISAVSPSRKSKGAMIITRKTSGSKWIELPTSVNPRMMPVMIWIMKIGNDGKTFAKTFDKVMAMAKIIIISIRPIHSPLGTIFFRLK